MGKRYTYSTRWEQNIVVFFHIYGARAIFLIFCDHQDNDSKSCEIKIGVAGPILTPK